MQVVFIVDGIALTILLAILLAIPLVMFTGRVRPRQMLSYILQTLYINTSFSLGCGAILFEVTVRMVFVVLIFLPLQSLLPGLVPFGADQYWYIHGSFLDILATAWPIFAWGGLMLLPFVWLMSWFITHPSVISRATFGANINGPIQIQINLPSPAVGMWQSIWIGIGEELGLRWLAFYSLIALLNMLGSLSLLDNALPRLYTFLVGPVVNFVTFGQFSSILFHPHWTWAVGGAIVILSFYHSERRFLPIKGNMSWLLYWLPNLFLYLVMFRYGLIAAMLVHLIYEAFLVVFVLTVGRRVIAAYTVAGRE